MNTELDILEDMFDLDLQIYQSSFQTNKIPMKKIKNKFNGRN